MTVILIATIIRIVAYAIMIPGSVYLAIDRYNAGQPRFAAIMAIYGLANLLILVALAVEAATTSLVAQQVRSLLTPVVVFQALIFAWIIYDFVFTRPTD